MVALRKESVDRKCQLLHSLVKICVALRKESVDRKMRWVAARINTIASLSARRAWIEKQRQATRWTFCPVALRKESVDRKVICPAGRHDCNVALRKESVDRKIAGNAPMKQKRRSLSARRAWIEKFSAMLAVQNLYSRSPQGERG